MEQHKCKIFIKPLSCEEIHGKILPAISKRSVGSRVCVGAVFANLEEYKAVQK